MQGQHLYNSPAIEVYGHFRLPLLWPRVPSWFFLQSGVEKLLAWAAVDWTDNPLDLCFQSGDYDLSATANLIDIHILFKSFFNYQFYSFHDLESTHNPCKTDRRVWRRLLNHGGIKNWMMMRLEFWWRNHYSLFENLIIFNHNDNFLVHICE